MYTTPLFGGERDLHVGIDIGAPVGTEVHSFADGIIIPLVSMTRQVPTDQRLSSSTNFRGLPVQTMNTQCALFGPCTGICPPKALMI
jgi:large-conductance mechanosensitive channel